MRISKPPIVVPEGAVLKTGPNLMATVTVGGIEHALVLQNGAWVPVEILKREGKGTFLDLDGAGIRR